MKNTNEASSFIFEFVQIQIISYKDNQNDLNFINKIISLRNALIIKMERKAI